MNTSDLMHYPLFKADNANLPNHWQTADDRVMGGVSIAHMSPAEHIDTQGVCLRGQVSLENRGGFIQIKWPVSGSDLSEIDHYTGIYIRAWGNGESYNVHLRTRALWLPWQSYRHRFIASTQPQYHYFSFDTFEPYKTAIAFRPRSLKKIAIVAFGRAFAADVCVGEMGFYAQPARSS